MQIAIDLNARSFNAAQMARTTGSHAEITGPAVRSAALRLFARSGYAAVSMREIAKEVGVRAGALYLYTPDKQTLLFDLMQEHMKQLLDAWQELPKHGAPLDRLQQFVHFHIDYHVERRDEVFLAYMELRSLSERNFDTVQNLRRAYEGELEAILDDGQSGGAFDLADVRVTTMALIAMLTGVNTWFRDDGRLNRENLKQIYWRSVRRMVLA